MKLTDLPDDLIALLLTESSIIQLRTACRQLNLLIPNLVTTITHSRRVFQIPPVTQFRFLKFLDVSHNYIGVEGVKLLHLPRSLLHLDVGNNLLKDEGLRLLTQKLPPGLTELILFENDFGDVGASALAAAVPPALRTLKLQCNRVNYAGIRELAERVPCTIRRLDINRNINAGTAVVALRPALHLLQDLDIGFTYVGNEGANEVVDKLKSVRRLVLSGCRLTHVSSRYADSLEHLNLAFNDLGPQGAKDLPPLLRYLDLRYNKIGDEGASVLCCYVRLQYLDLGWNEITEWFSMPPCLTALILAGNCLKEKAFSAPPSLKLLDIHGNAKLGKKLRSETVIRTIVV